eukprot:10382916-Ditylum_brightwellii.AAC.1
MEELNSLVINRHVRKAFTLRNSMFATDQLLFDLSLTGRLHSFHELKVIKNFFRNRDDTRSRTIRNTQKLIKQSWTQ